MKGIIQEMLGTIAIIFAMVLGYQFTRYPFEKWPTIATWAFVCLGVGVWGLSKEDRYANEETKEKDRSVDSDE